MDYTQEITLDLNSNGPYQTVSAKQGDSARYILIHLTKNNIDYEIDVTHSFLFRMRKPDGHAVILGATIESSANTNNEYFNGNTVRVQLTEESLRVAGRGYADLVEYDANQNVLSTISFIVNIMASPDVSVQVTSTDDFTALVSVLAQTDELIEGLNEAAAAPWTVMNVTATTSPAGSQASVTGAYHSTATPPYYEMNFSIPAGAAGTSGAQGERGPNTVWYGTTEPTGAEADEYSVWINPEGAINITGYIVDAGDVMYDASKSYTEENSVGYLLKTLDPVAIEAAAASVIAFQTQYNYLLDTIESKQNVLPTSSTEKRQYFTSIPTSGTVTQQWTDVDYNDIINLPTIQSTEGGETVYHEIKGNNLPVALGLAPANPNTNDGSYYFLPSGQTLIEEPQLSQAVQNKLNRDSNAINTITINERKYSTNPTLNNEVNITESFLEVLQPQSNYLENPFFTIQQRIDSKSENFVVDDFICDRWKVTATEGGSINYEPGLIEFSSPTNNPAAISISQLVSDDVINSLQSNAVTISVKYSETRTGEIKYIHKTTNFFNDGDDISVQEEESGAGLQIRLYETTGNTFGHYLFEISVAGHSDTLTRYIHAVKVEIGEYNTLMVDAAPLYSKELSLCQKYYSVITNPLKVEDVPASATAQLNCYAIGNGVARASGLFSTIHPPAEMVKNIPLTLTVMEVAEDTYTSLQTGLHLIQANNTNNITASFPTDREIHGYSLGQSVSVVLSVAATSSGYEICLPTNQILVIDSKL